MMDSTKTRWLTIFAIVILATASVFQYWWVWGLLFIWWAIHDVISGWTFLVDQISRRENVILFWMIVLLWFSYGVYIFSDILS